MKPAAPPPPPSPRRWWLAGLAAALLFLAADGWREVAAHRSAAALGEAGRPLPPRSEKSATGYVFGQRGEILASTDGYHWVMQTQQLLADGAWRVRHVDYDNAPHGRDVHWATTPHLWLALLAGADHLLTGTPAPIAVERAAVYAGPLLLALILVPVSAWAARRLGAAAAVLLAAGLVALAPVRGEFGGGSFDHHGIAAVLALLSVLGLVAADPRRAPVLAALAGAGGLWLNAATQLPVLAGIALGALATGAGSADFWRRWGRWGGAAAFVAYLLEYFPAHLGWRLEVNHPLYALAWAGGGELLARWRAHRADRRGFATPRDQAITALALLAVAGPAVAFFGFARKTFVVADPLLWALHADYIQEFSPLWERFRGADGAALARLIFVNPGLFPLLAAIAVFRLRRDCSDPERRARLGLAIAPALLFALLALKQERWLHIEVALWLGALAGAIAILPAGFWKTRTRQFIAAAAAALALLPYPLEAAASAWRARPGLSPEELRQFVVRDLAYWLRRRTGEDGATVISGPTVTTELVYHGGFRGVGTLYWENLEGLRALVGIYGAASPDEALARLQARGVTHLVIFSRGSFAAEAARLARDRRADEPVPADAFLVGLLESGRGLPNWVRPLTYRLPAHPLFREEVVFVLALAPGQSPADAAVRRAQFLASFGNIGDAAALVRSVLQTEPRHLPALIALATFERIAGRRAEHRAAVERAAALVATAPALEPADRIMFALELAAAGAADPARREVARVWREAGERELRALPPEILAVLLTLTRDAPPPDLAPARRAFAERLQTEDFPASATRP